MKKWETFRERFISNFVGSDIWSTDPKTIEWWISYAHNYPDLYFARLRTFSNGLADVTFQDENKCYRFDDEESARNYMSEDEFEPFDKLDEEERRFIEIPENLVVEAPGWSDRNVQEFVYIGKY